MAGALADQRQLARQHGFLASDDFPCAFMAAADININDSVLAGEDMAILLAAGSPGGCDHGRRTVNANVNIGDDESRILDVGTLDGRNQVALIADFAGCGDTDEVVGIDTIEEAGIVQGHGVSGFFLKSHNFLGLNVKFGGECAFLLLPVADDLLRGSV